MENLSRREKEKLSHENEIIAAAEKVFCLKGYEDASMDEIAKEAQFTKRTVYQHFESKEDLYFAVVIKNFERLLAKIKSAGKKSLSGFDRVEQACRSYYLFSKENSETFRLISNWGYLGKKSTNSKRKNDLIEFNHTLLCDIAKMIEEGKEDGSIPFDVDSEKAACSIVFLMTGFFNQFAATGEDLTQKFSLDSDEFSLFTIDFVMKTLRKNRNLSSRKGTA